MRLGDEGWGIVVAFILIFGGMKRGGTLSKLRDEEGGGGEGVGVNE